MSGTMPGPSDRRARINSTRALGKSLCRILLSIAVCGDTWLPSESLMSGAACMLLRSPEKLLPQGQFLVTLEGTGVPKASLSTSLALYSLPDL